ncbi:MAG: hypothetical protein QNK23_00905 [Crocinitomicaceae bacterium]|nr:hypothetical protein [Crocinitomicaceae bacterium]
MKRILLLAAVAFTTTLNAQTILYESDDFLIDGWSVIETNTNVSFNVDSFSGLLEITNISNPDTVLVDLVKSFTNISGLDSIQIDFNMQDAINGFGLNIYTSNDSSNWNLVAGTYDTPTVETFNVYQSDLNSTGLPTYVRMEFIGGNTFQGVYMLAVELFDFDISTYVNVGIDEVSNDMNIYSIDGALKIESESILSSVEVFTTDGRLVYQSESLNDTNASISLPQENVYFVSIVTISGRSIVKKIYIQ